MQYITSLVLPCRTENNGLCWTNQKSVFVKMKQFIDDRKFFIIQLRISFTVENWISKLILTENWPRFSARDAVSFAIVHHVIASVIITIRWNYFCYEQPECYWFVYYARDWWPDVYTAGIRRLYATIAISTKI